MKPDEMMTLYEYAWWARDRLPQAASGMTDEEFGRDNGFTYPSIRSILVHAMEAEMSWAGRRVNHGTQHRSEAAEAPTLAGRSPGSLDLTTFVWDL